jgi:electron transport complex protein RnfD
MESRSLRLVMSGGPHIAGRTDISRVMSLVIASLLPLVAFGIYRFGWYVLAVVTVSVATAVVSELAVRALLRRPPHVGDGSAVVTGLLLALIMPPSAPLWMVAIGSATAIIVAKELFGGLGGNPFNPALIGRAILLMSWPAFMTRWGTLREVLADATTSATPLAAAGKAVGDLSSVMRSVGASDRSAMYWQLLIGNRGGSIGETCALLILAALVLLVLLRVVDFRIPTAMIGTTAVLYAILGRDPLFGVLSGGLLFGAVFMATDYVTTPLTPLGKWLFGIGAGAVTVLIRLFGGFPEGVTYGILIMNLATPFLDRVLPRKFGYVKPTKAVS